MQQIDLNLRRAKMSDFKNEKKYLPDAKKSYQEVGRKFRVQELRSKVQVRYQGRLKHNRHIRSIKKFDGIRPLLSSETSGLYRNLHTKALKVCYDEENKESCQ